MTDAPIPLSSISIPAEHAADAPIPLSSISIPSEPGAPPPKMSRTARFATGLLDPIYGAEQLLLHAIPVNDFLHSIGVPGVMSAKEFDQWLATREKGIKESSPKGTDWWRLGGSVANPLLYAAPEGAMPAEAGRVAAAVMGGMRSAALQPAVQGSDFLGEKGRQLAEGAAAGGVAHGVAGGVAKAVAGELRPAAQLLVDEGVRLTPGQQLGGVPRRAEEAAKSLPILGTAIRHGEEIAKKDFNLAAYNRVLAPLGVKYEGSEIGNKGIKALREKLSGAYDSALHDVTFRADPKFALDLHQLDSMVTELPDEMAQQFRKLLANRVIKRLEPTGTMSGETFKQVEDELEKFATRYQSSTDAAQRDLGDAVEQMNALLRENLARTNPAKAAELKKVNAAWAMFARLRKAAATRATSDGVFSPADLLATTRAADKRVDKGAFAEGDALLQDLAAAGHSVISNKMSETLTPERLMWDFGGGALLGHELSLGVPAGLAAAAIPYTGPAMTAQRALTAGLAGPRRAAASALEGVPPLVAPVLGAGAASPEAQPQ